MDNITLTEQLQKANAKIEKLENKLQYQTLGANQETILNTRSAILFIYRNNYTNTSLTATYAAIYSVDFWGMTSLIYNARRRSFILCRSY